MDLISILFFLGAMVLIGVGVWNLREAHIWDKNFKNDKYRMYR
jgi:hypothetical protein